MELSVMDRINLILSDPEKATMTLAQIVSEEIREFKKSEQYQIILEAESYYRNRSSVQKKTVDVANRSNAKIERPILKKLVDQKANYLLSKPWTVDTESGEYGEALNKVFDQTFLRKIKSLGKGAVKSGIAWIQPYFDDAGELAFMRVPPTEVVPLWRDSERTKLDAFIRFYDQIIYVGTRKHTITHAEFWWTGGVRYNGIKNPNVIRVGQKIKIPASTAPAALKKGDRVKVLNAVTYDGKPFRTYYDTYDVIQVSGARVMIGVGATVTAAVNAANLRKV